MTKIKIGKGELEYTRPSLKKWLLLQDQLSLVYDAIKNRNDVAKHFVSYVALALDIQEQEIVDLHWIEVAEAYLIITDTNKLKREFPLLNTQMKNKKEIWDYVGRTWYIWAHLLCKTYGFNLEYTANLDVDDAIGLAQEIAVDEQLTREWQWMTSEIAYQTKDGFKKLPRPDWMQYNKDVPVIPKLLIRKDFMPVGIVYKWDKETKL